jgi:hypothetical protein
VGGVQRERFGGGRSGFGEAAAAELGFGEVRPQGHALG